MSTKSPNFQISSLAEGQGQQHLTINDALRRIDNVLQLVISNQNLRSPAASPMSGQAWIISQSADGDWLVHRGKIALYEAGAWNFIVPKNGWVVFDNSALQFYYFNGDRWRQVSTTTSGSSGPSTQVPRLGINTAPEQDVALVVSGDEVLLTADADSSGDHTLRLNKQQRTNSTRIRFETNRRARGAIATMPDDGLGIFVDHPGSGLVEAISFTRGDARANIPHGVVVRGVREEDTRAFAHAQRSITLNGNIAFSQNQHVKWDDNWTIMPSGLPGRYDFDAIPRIQMPAVGTAIHGLAGSANRTVLATGIRLEQWETLYYQPRALRGSTIGNRFLVCGPSPLSEEITPSFIWLAIYSGDIGKLLLADGSTLSLGQSKDDNSNLLRFSGAGHENSSTAASTHTMVSEDNLGAYDKATGELTVPRTGLYLATFILDLPPRSDNTNRLSPAVTLRVNEQNHTNIARPVNRNSPHSISETKLLRLQQGDKLSILMPERHFDARDSFESVVIELGS